MNVSYAFKLDPVQIRRADTYDDPEVAYKQVSSALMMLSEGINKSQDQNLADSVRLGGVDMINE